MVKAAIFFFLLTTAFVARETNTSDRTLPIQDRRCVRPPNGMVAWWDGDGTPNDIQGPSFLSGQMKPGATFTNAVGGMVGRAFTLNGANGFIHIPTQPYSGELSMSGSFTIDAWIKLKALTPPDDDITKTILSKEEGVARANKTNYNFHVFDNRLRGAFNFSSGPPSLSQHHIIQGDGGCDPGCFVDGETSLSAGQYYHAAFVYDDSDKRLILYLNGMKDGEVKFDTLDSPVVTSQQLVRIGVRSQLPLSTGTNFNGIIDELELFKRALSPQEIVSIFTAGRAGKCKRSTTWPS